MSQAAGLVANGARGPADRAWLVAARRTGRYTEIVAARPSGLGGDVMQSGSHSPRNKRHVVDQYLGHRPVRGDQAFAFGEQSCAAAVDQVDDPLCPKAEGVGAAARDLAV